MVVSHLIKGATTMAKFIRDWTGLVGLESEHYKLKIDTEIGCGWIVPKTKTDEINKYLSTHTFYGSCYKEYTKLLQNYGFDIELDNWDKPRRS